MWTSPAIEGHFQPRFDIPPSLSNGGIPEHQEGRRTLAPMNRSSVPAHVRKRNRAAKIPRGGAAPSRRKVLCVASRGGHWIQLKRLMPALEGTQTVFVSTHPSYDKDVPGKKFYSVLDSSRWNKFRLLITAIQVLSIVWQERPNVVISTGAAPGLFGIIFGKLLGCRTLWLDSIANAEQLSMSGQIAAQFSDLRLTQWKQLAGASNVEYRGTVMY